MCGNFAFMANEKEKALKLAGERTALIDKLNVALEKIVGKSQGQLLDLIVSEFVDNLDSKDGQISNTLNNKRLVGLLDAVFKKYGEEHGPAVSGAIVNGVSNVLAFNKRYFGVLDKPANLVPIQKDVTTAVSSWLGVEEGKVARNGYLDTLVKADSVKQQVKDLAMAKVVGQTGLTELRKSIKEMLGGNPDTLGRLANYYRNFTYDLYSQVDRTAAKITADKLGLQYAIYEGGLIKTSRKFCRERNGKVFTSEEIAEFDPPEAKQPDYNPATDLGGYGCRHHLNYIPYAVAVSLRPDLKNDNPKPPVKPEPPKPEDPSPASQGVEEPKRPPAKQPFNDIPDYEIPKFKPSVEQQRAMDSFAGYAPQIEKADKILAEIRKERTKAFNEYYNSGFSDPNNEKKTDEFFKWKGRLEKGVKARQEILDKVKVFEDAFRKEMMKDKKAESQIKIDIPPALKKDPGFQAQGAKAFDFFRKIAAGWTDDFNFDISVKAIKGRASAVGNTIRVTKDESARVIVHELGHILEMNHNTIMKAAVDFLNRRTAGKKIQKLKNMVPGTKYAPSEVAREGGFYNPYVGKLYQSNKAGLYNSTYATEVISMGLEYMYENPIKFFRSDPEHFALIYSLFIK